MNIKRFATFALAAYALATAGAGARADDARRLNFESPADRFELTLRGSTGTVDGKPADLSVLRTILPALTNDVTNACPEGLKERPDLSVREGTNVRRIYIKRGLVALGDQCLNVGGEGLFFAPVHREYLIGPKRDQIPLASDLSFVRDGRTLLQLKQRAGDWIATDPERLPNRDFIERFANSVRDFAVAKRAGLGLTEGKPRLNVRSGGHVYEFYRISDLAWALKKPGGKWLVTSDDWSFWDSFDEATLEDPYAAQIHAAGDTSKSVGERTAAITQLGGTWSPNLRALYHRIVREEPGNDALRTLAIKQLKRKPSNETAGVMIEVLAGDAGDDVKREAGVILKLQNPKGPKYNPRASAVERAKTIEFWRHWWKKDVS